MTEECCVCGKDIEIDIDGEYINGRPRTTESVEGGFRCENCQKVVHALCAHHTDVCDACCADLGGCEDEHYITGFLNGVPV